MDPVLLGVLGYALAQLVVGIAVSRRIRSEDDYFVAGRRLGPVLVTVSVFATWFGAETCVGAAGQVYRDGLSRTSVEPFAYGVCLFVMGLVFAVPLWRRRITTLADLFRLRFSSGVERFAAILLIPTSVLWAAAQVRAFGQVLSASSRLEIETALAIAALFTIGYTVFGGLLADVITDLVQGIALVVGLVVVTWAVIGGLGGLEAAGRSIRFAGLSDGAPAPSLVATLEAWALPICGSVVAQEVISRTVAARSPAAARAAGLCGGSIYLLVGFMPVFLGLVGAAMLPDLADPEQLLPQLARLHLTDLGYVLFAGALVSAILSTVDSALLVASSLLSRNLVLAGSPDASQRKRLAIARGGVALFGLVAWWLAHRSDGVFDLVEQASGFGSAGILVIVVFGLFTTFGRAGAAFAALVGGSAAWVVGRYVVADFELPYLVSLGVALSAYVGIGILGRRYTDRGGP